MQGYFLKGLMEKIAVCIVSAGFEDISDVHPSNLLPPFLEFLHFPLVLAKVGDGRGMGWKFGISRCKLLYTCIAITLPYTRS